MDFIDLPDKEFSNFLFETRLIYLICSIAIRELGSLRQGELHQIRLLTDYEW